MAQEQGERPTPSAIGLDSNGLVALENHPLDRRASDDGQVIRRRDQEIIGRRAVSLVARVDKNRHADGVSRVVIRVEREASLVEQIQHREQILLPLASISYVEAARVSVVVGLGRSIAGVNTLWDITVEGLETLVTRLNSVPAESIVADDTRPLVVVVTSTDGVDSKVDCARTSEALSTRVVALSVITVLLGRGLVAIVHTLVHKSGPPLAVDSEVAIIIVAAGLEE